MAGKGKAAEKKDDKKGKAPPPKGGKGYATQLAIYESNLPMTSAGLESVILLIDNKLESLPLENLKVFRDVPVMSRDFNLHMYMQIYLSIHITLQNAGYRPRAVMTASLL